MPPKGIVPNMFGERKVFIEPYDGGEAVEFKHLDADSIFLSNPIGEMIEDYDSFQIDFPEVKMENRGRDILFAISDGKRTTEPVSAVINTEIVTDNNNLFTGFSLKLKVNGREMREAIEKLIWGYKHLKPRKTTYKTIRHDCAKRNGRR